MFILDDLSQRQLPLSFRYYDPIIRITFNRMSSESKQYFCQHTKNKLSKYQQGNVWDQLKGYILRTVADSDKMSYRFSQVNVPDSRKDGPKPSHDPMRIKHAKSLQRS